jgi:hypothetical protein
MISLSRTRLVDWLKQNSGCLSAFQRSRWRPAPLNLALRIQPSLKRGPPCFDLATPREPWRMGNMRNTNKRQERFGLAGRGFRSGLDFGRWAVVSLCILAPLPEGQCQPGTAALKVPEQWYMSTNSMGPVTNGPAVFDEFIVWQTNIAPRFPSLLQHMPTNVPPDILDRLLTLRTQTVTRVSSFTNLFFDHFFSNSLNYLLWTNFIAHTNGRSMVIWSERKFPPGWPATPPVIKWDHNCLMWGMKGETALSPAWEAQGAPGQIPITLLTRRHGYTRGHDMGPDGFHTINAGKRVWFVTKDNVVVEAKILREVVRTVSVSHRDYTIFLFDRDMPPDLETLRVVRPEEFIDRYRFVVGEPWVVFETEQTGRVSANVPGFSVPTYKGGDSGSPNLLPFLGELYFVAGRTTSGASAEMQADMDQLCREEHLDPRAYQLKWVSLAEFPRFYEDVKGEAGMMVR